MTGAAIMGQFNAILQSGVEQQLAIVSLECRVTKCHLMQSRHHLLPRRPARISATKVDRFAATIGRNGKISRE
jgi:hypothetical protein